MIGEARGLAATGGPLIKRRKQPVRQPTLRRRKRLLLAALRVWELKHGINEQ